MIELRYLEYEYIHRSPVLPSLDMTEIKLKLQYRTYPFCYTVEASERAKWSEWLDVPTVKGE